MSGPDNAASILASKESRVKTENRIVAAHGCRPSAWARRARVLMCAATGVWLLQATGGCEETFSNITSTLGEKVLDGAATGLGNLAQALVLNALI